MSIDDIPVDIANTPSGDVDPTDVPDAIESVTRGRAGEQPPMNPLVVLKAARWWYLGELNSIGNFVPYDSDVSQRSHPSMFTSIEVCIFCRIIGESLRTHR